MLGGGAGGVGEQEVPGDRDQVVQEFRGEGCTPADGSPGGPTPSGCRSPGRPPGPESDASHSGRRVQEAGRGQDRGMRRRTTPQPDDVDLRDQSAQVEAQQEESAVVANPRRTRR